MSENSDVILSGKKPPDTPGVRALDDHHLQLKLSEPVPYFIALVANSSLMPVNRNAVEKWRESWTRASHYVGNGACSLVCTFYYELNNKRPPSNDVHVRIRRQTDTGSRHHRQRVPVNYRVSARLVKPGSGGFTGKDPQGSLT